MSAGSGKTDTTRFTNPLHNGLAEEHPPHAEGGATLSLTEDSAAEQAAADPTLLHRMYDLYLHAKYHRDYWGVSAQDFAFMVWQAFWPTLDVGLDYIVLLSYLSNGNDDWFWIGLSICVMANLITGILLGCAHVNADHTPSLRSSHAATRLYMKGLPQAVQDKDIRIMFRGRGHPPESIRHIFTKQRPDEIPQHDGDPTSTEKGLQLAETNAHYRSWGIITFRGYKKRDGTKVDGAKVTEDALILSDQEKPQLCLEDGTRICVSLERVRVPEDYAAMRHVFLGQTKGLYAALDASHASLSHLGMPALKTFVTAMVLSLLGLAPAAQVVRALRARGNGATRSSDMQEKMMMLQVIAMTEAFFESLPQGLMQTYIAAAFGTADPSSANFNPFAVLSILDSTMCIATAAVGLEDDIYRLQCKYNIGRHSRYGVAMTLLRWMQLLSLFLCTSLMACAFKAFAWLVLGPVILTFILISMGLEPWIRSGKGTHRWIAAASTVVTCGKLPLASMAAMFAWSMVHISLTVTMGVLFFELDHVENNYANQSAPFASIGAPQHYNCRDRTHAINFAFITTALCVPLSLMATFLHPEYNNHWLVGKHTETNRRKWNQSVIEQTAAEHIDELCIRSLYRWVDKFQKGHITKRDGEHWRKRTCHTDSMKRREEDIVNHFESWDDMVTQMKGLDRQVVNSDTISKDEFFAWYRQEAKNSVYKWKQPKRNAAGCHLSDAVHPQDVGKWGDVQPYFKPIYAVEIDQPWDGLAIVVNTSWSQNGHVAQLRWVDGPKKNQTSIVWYTEDALHCYSEEDIVEADCPWNVARRDFEQLRLRFHKQDIAEVTI
jgi:hypothetical protein